MTRLFISTGGSSDGLECDETVELTDLNGWLTGQTVNHREKLLARISAGDTVVLRSVTFLLAFWPPGEAARLLLDIKHAVGGGKGGAGVATVHADCVDEWLLAQLQPLATTVIDVARESSKRIYPKICTVTHRYKLKSLGT